MISKTTGPKQDDKHKNNKVVIQIRTKMRKKVKKDHAQDVVLICESKNTK